MLLNLSNKFVSRTEMKVLETGFDFGPAQKTIIKPELRQDLK